MALAPGTRLGPYEVTALLGEGGMGQVYRARDTKLHRDVALKVLPESFVNDPDRLARFQREAQVLASLNHPNIAHIHGLEDSAALRALVMELVEGEDLAQRLMRGAIPIDEALRIAKQIAGALAAAHEQGIIHRDLKPANIKVRDDGTVKVLDFGLAKALEPAAGSSPNMSMSPTITTPAMTAAGMILGTAAYMSPEQAKGRPADKRSDIWAFGCVLYEMLTGKRAFDADDVADTLAAVLRSEPDWSAFPASTPRQVKTLIRRSLTRNPAERVGDMAVPKFLLAELEEDERPVSVGPTQRSRRREWVAWALAALLAMGWFGYASLNITRLPASADSRVVRATFDPPPGTSFLLAGGNATLVQVSPNGSQIVFATAGDVNVAPKLWLRSIDAAEARPLAGTDRASSPFWSRDSKYLAFFLGRQLMKLEIQSGTVSSICDLPAPNGRGGTWNQMGDIVFSVPDDRHLYRVRADGGSATQLTLSGVTDRDQDLYPQFLPDGRHFLFLRKSIELNRQGLYVGSLDSNDITFVVKSRWNGAVVGNQLMYLSPVSTALMTQPIDLTRFVLTGSPQRLVDQIAVSGPGLSDSRAQFSLSENGVLVYHRTMMTESQITWVDRSGHAVAAVGTPGIFANPRLSPDGTALAIDRWDAQRGDTHVWLFDLPRGTSAPLRTGDGTDESAVWSADGAALAFVGAFEDAVRLYTKDVKTDQVTKLADLERVSFPNSWSADGTMLLTQNSNELDLIALERGEKTAKPFAGGLRTQVQGEWSPDGKLVAYNSSETGSAAVYVQPRSGGARVLASTTVGNDPHWSGDGKHLYFEVRSTVTETEILGVRDGRVQLGPPTPVFPLQLRRSTLSFSNPFQTNYAVADKGQRFLYLAPTNTEIRHPMTIVVNWQALLKP